MKPLPVLFLATFLTTCAIAQNKDIDSLTRVLHSTAGESKIKTLLALCWEYRFVNADTARVFGEEALQMARKDGLREFEAEALNFIGVTHEAQGNYNEALSLELQALELRKTLGDDSKTAKTMNDIGIIYDEKGDYEKSLGYYFEARRIFERLKEPSKIAMVISNIGIVLKAQKEYKKVVGYYHEALAIYKKLNNKFGVAACDANLGSVYYNLERYDSALFYSLKATKEFEEQGNRQFLAMTICNAGMAYDRLSREDDARTYLLRAKKLYEAYDNKRELSFVLTYLAGVERKTGQLKQARENALSGLLLAEKIGARSQMMEARKELAEISAAAGDYRGAFREHQLYATEKDSLFQNEKSKQIAELQARYESEKKENEINLLTQENAVKDFRIQRNEFIMITLAVLIVGLVSIAYLLRNREKLIQRAELESTKSVLKDAQLQAVITSQENERRRFAADLHDGMGQMISALRLNLSHDPVQKSKVDEAVDILQEMNLEIRKIAFNLMPQVLLSSGLTEALTEFANRINRTGKVNVSIQAFSVNPQMPAQEKVALYRICQEWVNNVLKYSGALKISIQLVQHDEELVVTMEDNGSGFDTDRLLQSDGNGWKNINSRLGLIQGVIEIDSFPGRTGTTVTITIPAENKVMAA